jgi:uncharacterized membrane protein
VKNKRGLIGIVLLSVALVIIIIFGLIYFQVRTNGIQLKTGNIIIDINYQKKGDIQTSPEPNNSISQIDITPRDETQENETEDNLALELDNLSAQTENLIIEQENNNSFIGNFT